MGQKRTPGLFKREGVWHIDKQVRGQRIRESCGTCSLQEAEKYLAFRLEELRQTEVYGIRPTRTFEQAATKFVEENGHKRSLRCDIGNLRNLMPWIGDLELNRVNMGTLQPWLNHRRSEGVSAGTINHGLTWLQAAPKIPLLPDRDKRQPYPLNWEEQDRLLAELPGHMAQMALFKVNTGCRDAEVCNLRWDWECLVPELDTSVFIIPGDFVKNGEERLVVLNRIARSVVEARRDTHRTHVFSYNGKPLDRMGNSAWKRARQRAGLPDLRIHDLKHTFGRRLRAAGVSFEDRQDLLGHKSARMTTHYSAPELERLIAAAEAVCDRDGARPELVIMRGTRKIAPAKSPHGEMRGQLKSV
jgi:integrase